MPSVKDALQGKFKNEEKQMSAKEQFQMHTKADEFEAFTKEELEDKWKAFLTRLNDRPNLQATLSKVPEIRDNYELFMEVDNSFQQDSINLTKPELVSWLRRELRNAKIELTVKISKETKNKIIYTDLDKFDAMVKKNPNLAKLKQKLNLDLGDV